MVFDPSGMFSLAGKSAVVTGGGGDLCSTLALALSGAGARVALLDLDGGKAEASAEAVRAAGGTAMAFACDVLDGDRLREIAASLATTWGKPDFLINGAGGNVPSGSTSLDFLDRSLLDDPGARDFFDLDFEGVRRTFDLNFLGTYLPTRVFARGMVERGSGSILNIASVSALTPLTQVGAYSAAKAAVSSFTAWLAVHFAHTGVRVNAIAPGFFMTEQLRFLHSDPATGQPTPRSRKATGHTPMLRYGRPEELAGGVIYLLSDSASFVTGITLPIDGGFSSYSI